MRVFAVHLLNDYSGSPKVLQQLVKGWQKNNINVTIFTCSGRDGFLSKLPVRYKFFWYKWSANQYLRLMNFMISQFLLFIKVLAAAKKTDIVYVNTVLPFGAALAGKIKGCKIIYHIHETTVNPKLLKLFLFAVIKRCADQIIYVSKFLSEQEKIPGVSSIVILNAIEDSFHSFAKHVEQEIRVPKNVLMVASLKLYKGVFEFVKLASMNPHFNFRLVVNASEIDIKHFFHNTLMPANLVVYPTQVDTHRFYRWADIVLNLSKPDAWVETFGLTILEGMAYGLPAIVPPVGGVVELVEENVNGFYVDSRDVFTLSEKLNSILNNPVLYLNMRQSAFSKLIQFEESVFIEKSMALLLSVTSIELKSALD
jgi:L-malate glycosyltransferase